VKDGRGLLVGTVTWIGLLAAYAGGVVSLVLLGRNLAISLGLMEGALRSWWELLVFAVVGAGGYATVRVLAGRLD
jgi:hypothetical protein